jgi:hypothetical protein
MPQDVASLVWLVGGGLILILLAVIGFYTVRWMSRHDARADEVSHLLSIHDREIAVIKNDQGHVLSRIDETLAALKEHIAKEERFWELNGMSHQEILNRLGALETRHEAEDRRQKEFA